MLTDRRILNQIAPIVRRVMIVDPTLVSSRLLAELSKGLGARDLLIEGDMEAAYAACAEFEPTLIILERSGPQLDGEALARRIRRSRLSCRQAPILMVTADATANNIKAARDAGVHEFMVKPFTAGDLTRRVVNVATRPRNWVEAVGYVGPDRRRFNSGDYSGPRKRQGEAARNADAEALEQTRKIIVSAVQQFMTDPGQAVRAIHAQGEILKTLAIRTGRTKLAVAAAGLMAAARPGMTDPSGLGEPVRAVLAELPPATAGGRAA